MRKSTKALNCLLSGYKSFSFKNENCLIYFKGSIHIENSNAKIDEWIRLLLKTIVNKNLNFEEFLLFELKKISGLFSLVIVYEGRYYIAADIIRSLPVFYGITDSEVFITNNLDEYQKQNTILSTNDDKLEEFISSGFVFENGTIFKNAFGIQAGELVIIEDVDIQSYRYYKFKLDEKKTIEIRSLDDFTKGLDAVLLSVFSRMIEQTPSVNRWILPLSGGHDSRLIANYLYRLGIKNVICYTYGNLNNEQSEISKQVAEALGYDWHFVEYTEDKWEKLHKIGIIEKYIRFASNGVSTPHLQDFLAVHEMKESGVLEIGDVFIPGHTFDWLVGSNLSDIDLLCNDESSAIERTKSMHTMIKDEASYASKRIVELFRKNDIKPQYFQEFFNWQEKRSKFMVNSVKCYEFFGFDFRLPYWDKEIVEFWQKIPDKNRMGRKIFLQAEERGLIINELMSIPFYGKHDRSTPNYILVNLLRNLLPNSVKDIILKLSGRKVEYNTGLNNIYALRASDVKEIIGPIEDFPTQTRLYFKHFLNRYPYQMDYHFLTTLYCLRIQFNQRDSQN